MPYTPPYIGSQGLVLPVYADIKGDLIEAYLGIFGQQVYLGNDSADYQDICAFAAKIADLCGAIALAVNARSPRTATGAALDAVVSINGISRKAPSASSCVLTVTGTAGAVIANGIAEDVNGYLWDLAPQVTIPNSGAIMVSAICETIGAIAALPGQINIISNPQYGWTAVTNAVAAVIGQPIETDAQLRARQAQSVALPSQTLLAGTQAAIAATAGVTRYNVVENPTNATDANGNPAHSISCVVEGGADLDIATAIYENHGIGCSMNGTTTLVVTDATTGFQCPVGFIRPTYLTVYITMQVHGLSGFTTSTLGLIQSALVAYVASLQIGESLTYSSMYAVASSVMANISLPLFSIRSVAIGTSANPTGTTDLAAAFNQVFQTAATDVTVTAV